MNKAQFDKFSESLYEKDYKRYNQQWHNEDYLIGKSFHQEDNIWEENRAAYQIMISVYDYTVRTYRNNDYYDRLPKEMKSKVELEAHVCISRTISERLDLTFAIHDNDNIENLEQIAEAFYTSMCNLLPTPREEGTVYDTER